MLLKLAYRNIWRNKRRTLITAASIMFAVFFAVVMRSIQVGAWQKMIDSVVHFYFGYAQVQTEKYWEDKSIDDALLFDDALKERLLAIDGVETLVPRIESFGLAAYEEQSRGALIVGVDPEAENELSNLSTRVVEGSYLRNGDVLLTSGLAGYLGLGVGDTVVFLSQGYHGTNAAGKFPVGGIVSFPSPELNKQMAFISLPDAQWFFGADNLVTSLVIDPADPDEIKKLTAVMQRELATDDFVVKDYEELIPGLLQAKAYDEAGSYIILAVLYAIVGFGIFGTILMMLKERNFEFGVLKAIGMKTRQLQWMLWLETSFLSIIGCLMGAAISLPLVYYLFINPITFTGEMAEAYEKFGVDAVMPATVDPMIFLYQALVILVMNTIMNLYPLFKLKQIQPMEALHV